MLFLGEYKSELEIQPRNNRPFSHPKMKYDQYSLAKSDRKNMKCVKQSSHVPHFAKLVRHFIIESHSNIKHFIIKITLSFKISIEINLFI
jgi:hypothetical protein